MEKLKYLCTACIFVTMVTAQSYDDCTNTEGFVICRDLGWTSLPPELPDDTFSLQIFGGNIHEIPKSALISSRLTVLYLIDTGLKTLLDDQFFGLPNLSNLRIRNSSIETLPENILVSNPNLQNVILTHNKINKLPEKVFHPVGNLLALSVSNNKILNLPNDLLKKQQKLEIVDFSSNEIESVGDNAFQGASKVRGLFLNYNKLQEVPEQMFEQMPNIILLDIRANQIPKIPKAFLAAVHLTTFKFGENPLWCDCDMDWVRAKEWVGIDTFNKSVPDNSFLTYHSSSEDKKSQLCTGPGIYTGKYPWDFNTLCDVDECATMDKPCKSEQSTCVNTQGSYECLCNAGYRGQGHVSCQDINECEGDHGCTKKCINTIGSYVCECEPGYKYAPDGQCYDIDECTNESHKCSKFAACINIVASYSCECTTGFTGDGFTCKDIDECKLNLHKCHHNATCTNTIGSHVCRCKDSLQGDGKSCKDFNSMLMNRKVENRKMAGSTGGSGGTVTIVVVLIVLVLIIGIGGFIFVQRPEAIFKHFSQSQYYGEQPKTNDDAESLQPLTGPQPPQ